MGWHSEKEEVSANNISHGLELNLAGLNLATSPANLEFKVSDFKKKRQQRSAKNSLSFNKGSTLLASGNKSTSSDSESVKALTIPKHRQSCPLSMITYPFRPTAKQGMISVFWLITSSSSNLQNVCSRLRGDRGGVHLVTGHWNVEPNTPVDAAICLPV